MVIRKRKKGGQTSMVHTKEPQTGGLVVETSDLMSSMAMGWRSFVSSIPKGTRRRSWGSLRHSYLHDMSLGARLGWTNIIEPGCRISSSQMDIYSNKGKGRSRQRWKKPVRKLSKQPEQDPYMEELWPANSTICLERRSLKNRLNIRPQESISTITAILQKLRRNSLPEQPRRRTQTTPSCLVKGGKLCSSPSLMYWTKIQVQSLKKINLTNKSRSWQKSRCISKSITNRRSCRKLSKILKKLGNFKICQSIKRTPLKPLFFTKAFSIWMKKCWKFVASKRPTRMVSSHRFWPSSLQRIGWCWRRVSAIFITMQWTKLIRVAYRISLRRRRHALNSLALQAKLHTKEDSSRPKTRLVINILGWLAMSWSRLDTKAQDSRQQADSMHVRPILSKTQFSQTF